MTRVIRVVSQSKHFDPEDLTVLEFVLDVYNSGDPVVPDYGLGGLE
jgi:hypothetical protein